MMSNAHVDLAREWDVVIVGTGMGGSTLGYALASKGLAVLFIERGTTVPAAPQDVDPITPEERLARGWWPHPMTRRYADGRQERLFAAVGCALGGSTIHYAAALERMAASDFEPLQTESGGCRLGPCGTKNSLLTTRAQRPCTGSAKMAKNQRPAAERVGPSPHVGNAPKRAKA